MVGWLINDCLTCIPGTKTFWHDLLDWFPELIDKTNQYTPYESLPKYIEEEVKKIGEPDYIIRNASFFPPLNLKTFTISYLQDYYTGKEQENQIKVCNSSDLVIFNSKYLEEKYKKFLTVPYEVIPIGTDFSLFSKKYMVKENLDIKKNSILFVGSCNKIKGFPKLLELVDNTDYTFCFVMKDNFQIKHDRIKVFNKVNSETMSNIMNSCAFLLCLSEEETLHLAGIEAAACDLPILTTKVGVYYNLKENGWGRFVSENLIEDVKNMFKDLDTFTPRKVFEQFTLKKEDCKNSWISIQERILN